MHSQVLELINIVLHNNRLDIMEKLDHQLSLRNDLGMDSINLAELSVRIEDVFGIDVFEHGMVQTVGEILEKIQRA